MGYNAAPLEKLIEEFGKFQGVGRKGATRMAYQVLPIKNKADNNWKYGLLVPGIAPFVGAALAALFVHGFLGMF